MSLNLHVILLAAGRGERMASTLPKVLHPVGGQPMIARILKTLKQVDCKSIRVVVSQDDHFVTSVAGKFKASCFEQSTEAWGTAKAVLAAKPEELKGHVLIMNGDHPLVTPSDITYFVQAFQKLSADCVVGSFKNPQPSEFGRLVLSGDQLVEIVEAHDLEKRKIHSDYINGGMYLIKGEWLAQYLNKIQKNQKGEYGLTDIVKFLNEDNLKVCKVDIPWNMAFGVNNQHQLSIASAVAFENKCYELMSQGVIVVDVKNTYVESDVTVGHGSMIYPGVYLKGRTKIGSFCAVESHAFILDSIVESYVNIRAGSYLDGASVGERSVIGPYAHLRPETVIGKECRIGNFVETKKLNMKDKSKASHLSYLGDAEVGSEVNIGCGTVTCNYGVDKQKRKTKIEDGVFIGSGSQLVAPVTISQGAVVGAGSVITQNVPKDSLALERSEQKNIKNYKKKN